MHTQRGSSRINIALRRQQAPHSCWLSDIHNYRLTTNTNNQGHFFQLSQVKVSIKPIHRWLLQIHFGKLIHSSLLGSSTLIHIQHRLNLHMLGCLHSRILKGKTTRFLSGRDRQHLGNTHLQNSLNDHCNLLFELNYVKLRKLRELIRPCMCKTMISLGTCNNCFGIIDASDTFNQVTYPKASYMGPLYTD